MCIIMLHLTYHCHRPRFDERRRVLFVARELRQRLAPLLLQLRLVWVGLKMEDGVTLHMGVRE